jgi:excisionase family DNA binding protein
MAEIKIAPGKLLVRVPEAAIMLSISRSSMYDLVASGTIESVKVGRMTRIPVAALRRLVAGNSEKEPLSDQ